MLGQPGRIRDRSSHQAVPSQPFEMSVPVHAVVSEDPRHDPARHAEQKQQQRMFEFLDRTGHISHHKAGPQGEDASVGEPHLSQPHSGHFRRFRQAARQLKAVLHASGKQFRRGVDQRFEEPPYLPSVIPNAMIDIRRHRNTNLLAAAWRAFVLGYPFARTRPGSPWSVHSHPSSLITEEGWRISLFRASPVFYSNVHT